MMDLDHIKQQISELPLDVIKEMNRKDSLRLILSCLDLTTLEGNDTDEKVKSICFQARGYENLGLPNVAAVCVYPSFAKLVRKELEGSEVNTACVAGAFPSGQSLLSLRLDEVKFAIDEGAQEIDMVISRGRFLQGDYDFVTNEIEKTKEVCGSVHLKVILETGELITLDNTLKASKLAIDAGADFIKTSTGKIQPAATPEAMWVMLEAIREHHQQTGKMTGIKPAGGIAEPNQAILYANLVMKILGPKWLTNKYFRIGASRLAGNIANELQS